VLVIFSILKKLKKTIFSMLDPICNGYFWYFNLCVGYGKSWLISGNAQMMVENECNEKGTKVDF
jgi:hypothetical protein